MGAGYAAAQNHYFGRGHTGHAAQQHATPALRFFQRMRAHLWGQPAGHFRHRGQQRQRAIGGGDGFIGNADRAGVEQLFGLRRIRGQVQIGEQDLTRAQLLALVGLRFFDLYDHVGAGEDFIGGVQQRGTGGDVVLIGQARAQAGTRLHHHLVAVMHQLMHRRGDQAYAIFVVLDFLGDADTHAGIPCG